MTGGDVFKAIVRGVGVYYAFNSLIDITQLLVLLLHLPTASTTPVPVLVTVIIRYLIIGVAVILASGPLTRFLYKNEVYRQFD